MPRFSITPIIAAEDQELSHAQFRLLAIFAAYADSKTGWCFPSMTTLASKMGISDRAVRKHVSVLVKKGYIERRAGNGEVAKTRVKYDLDTPPPEGVLTQEKSPFSAPAPGAVKALDQDLFGGGTSGTGAEPEVPGGAEPEVPPERLKVTNLESVTNSEPRFPESESSRTYGQSKDRPTEKEITEWFENWWPGWGLLKRKQGKAECLKLVKKIIKDQTADFDTLLNGLKDFIDYHQAIGTEPQFVMQPARWLRNRRWEDDLQIQHDKPNRSTSNESAAETAIRVATRGSSPDQGDGQPRDETVARHQALEAPGGIQGGNHGALDGNPSDVPRWVVEGGHD